MHNSKALTLDSGVIEFVDKAKYLGVMLKVGRKFGVDVQYMKSNFYYSFNSVFHCVAKFQNELVVLQLVTTFCQPYLLYCTECSGGWCQRLSARRFLSLPAIYEPVK